MGIYIPGVSMPKDGECIVVYGDGEVWHHGKRIAKVGTALETDYISREAALKFQLTANLRPEKLTAAQAVADVIAEYIKAISAADVRPVKRGEWIPVTNGRGGHECDQCHNYAPSYQTGEERLSDFCPNCGAKMGGADR